MESKDRRVNVIGWVAAFLIVSAYYFLSTDLISKTSLTYNLLNLIGGIGLAYRVYIDRNWSNFILEIIFCLIALKSIII
jgi:hypothetical protein